MEKVHKISHKLILRTSKRQYWQWRRLAGFVRFRNQRQSGRWKKISDPRGRIHVRGQGASVNTLCGKCQTCRRALNNLHDLPDAWAHIPLNASPQPISSSRELQSPQDWTPKVLYTFAWAMKTKGLLGLFRNWGSTPIAGQRFRLPQCCRNWVGCGSSFRRSYS